jgi:hypothetical protein
MATSDSMRRNVPHEHKIGCAGLFRMATSDSMRRNVPPEHQNQIGCARLFRMADQIVHTVKAGTVLMRHIEFASGSNPYPSVCLHRYLGIFLPSPLALVDKGEYFSPLRSL